MLEFTPPTIEYTEAVHRRDMELAAAHRQAKAVQSASHKNILDRIISLIWRKPAQRDNSETRKPDSSQKNGYDLFRDTNWQRS